MVVESPTFAVPLHKSSRNEQSRHQRHGVQTPSKLTRTIATMIDEGHTYSVAQAVSRWLHTEKDCNRAQYTPHWGRSPLG